MHISRLCVALSLAASMGFGCRGSAPSTVEVTGPKPAVFENVSPKDAAAKINFTAGNILLIRQGFTGLASSIAAKFGFGVDEGVRTVVIKSFAPSQRADVEWKLTSKVETAASIKARADFEKKKKPVGIGEAELKAPEPVYQTREVTGSVLKANLQSAHSLFLPAAWPEGITDAYGSGIIWLSSDVYENLVKSKQSTLDLGLFEPSISKTLESVGEFKTALGKLKGQVDQVGDRQDVYLFTADPDLTDWKLKVNGADVTVQVFKAHSWFGEIVVLNNPQNPLVLKVTVNPLSSGILDLVSGKSAFKDFLGYEVTELKDIQE